MSSKIISCSLPPELVAFLDENPQLSASKILQQGVTALMYSYNKGDLKELLEHERNKVKSYMETLKKQIEFINEKGLMEEFFNQK